MITLLPSHQRGRTRIEWLDSLHTFSFGDYVAPARNGFRVLRVVNEDRVAPARGFDTHGHRDMEILSYVVRGALAHRDSAGHQGTLRPGDIQHMSAGTGILHSEYNPSETEPVHFLQIWILPDRRGLSPNYQQHHFPSDARRNRLCPIAAPATATDRPPDALPIHQDAWLYGSLLDPGVSLPLNLAPGRHGWLQVIAGSLTLDSTVLGAGDGAAVSDEATLSLHAEQPSELVWFDLA